MGLMQIHLIAVCSLAVFYLIALTLVSGDDVILQKRSERNRLDMDRFMEEDRPRKRPFCNAFTGCGKKRSDESMGNLVDFNSEPVVQDLTKQFLSEAKLWEAIRLAKAELERRKEARQNLMPADLPVGLAIVNLRKKRSPTKPQEEENENVSQGQQVKIREEGRRR